MSNKSIEFAKDIRKYDGKYQINFWEVAQELLKKDSSYLSTDLIRMFCGLPKECSIDYPDGHDRDSFEGYNYIPLRTDSFIKGMKLLNDHLKKLDKKVKFIDAGCGYGDKVRLVEYLFKWEASGVEFFDEYVTMSKMFFNTHSRNFNDPHPIVKGDITSFNFSGFNVIYAYNPIQTYEGMVLFFENIIKTAVEGTILALANVYSGEEALYCKTVKKHIVKYDLNMNDDDDDFFPIDFYVLKK